MNLECVYVTSGLLTAEVIKAKLEAHDIPVLLQYESVGPIYGITVDGLGEVRVMVPAELAALARELLEDEGGSEDHANVW